MKFNARISTAVLVSIAGLLPGCGGPTSSSTTTITSTPSAPLASGGAASVYVVATPENSPTEVLQLPATLNGGVSITSMLTPPAGFTIASVATASSGQIYVGGYASGVSAYQILVYAAGATGSATPLRTIVDSNPSSVSPLVTATDSSGSIYAVAAGYPEIDVYLSTQSGTSIPSRVIAGSLTELAAPTDIAVDAAGNIYVTNGAAVLVFASGANGNVAPIRTITAPSGDAFTGVALDASGNIYTDTQTTTANATISGTILEYASSAAGAATPIRSITSPALSVTRNLRLDAAGNVYVVNDTYTYLNSIPSSVSSSVFGFGPTATGNATPSVEFTSPLWTVGCCTLASSYYGNQIGVPQLALR